VPARGDGEGCDDDGMQSDTGIGDIGAGEKLRGTEYRPFVLILGTVLSESSKNVEGKNPVDGAEDGVAG